MAELCHSACDSWLSCLLTDCVWLQQGVPSPAFLHVGADCRRSRRAAGESSGPARADRGGGGPPGALRRAAQGITSSGGLRP